MRGKLSPAASLSPAVRSIPAHAGETLSMWKTGRTAPVYPRPCGGNASVGLCAWSNGGLSPPMRGKPVRRAHHRVGLGSIPAHAGETRRWPGSTARTTVYPRPCGGNSVTGSADVVINGLSPPMRGKLLDEGVRRLCRRSIPAHAGETASTRSDDTAASVYPRPCGGNTAGLAPPIALMGLSPPMRGKRAFRVYPPGQLRSIPAHAGETMRTAVTPLRSTVYPRPCGGNLIDWKHPLRRMGLSPPMRGKRRNNGDHPSGRGSIPAHAGETSTSARAS